MERDNHKSKIIGVEEAKNLVRNFWKRATEDGLSYVWFGDNIEEYRGGYLIPTMIVENGVTMPNSYIRAWVKKPSSQPFQQNM